ncbi:MAG: class I SAM-dependent methyltransferase, partial [Kiritimatiellia bacterium]|nr:class I SAM-dependent methyltransferase [Kiritimatiellia bacterium]
LNPECAHVEADMRSVRLDRQFDAVFIHDAIVYMTTEEDVRAVLDTAAAHCREGGALLVMPDHTAETFVSTTGHGGIDAEDGRGARYLQWSYDPDPEDVTYLTLFDVMLRHADGRIENHSEQHTCGLFDRATWLRLMKEAGFDGRIVPFEHSELEEGACEMIAGRREDERLKRRDKAPRY